MLERLTPSERWKSLGYAVQGLVHAFRTQPNTWIMAVASIGVTAAGIVFRVGRIEWALLILSMGIVFVAELLNTALEALTDLASPERHPLAKRAKDSAAAAVLLAAAVAALIGAIIFLPRIEALGTRGLGS